MKSYNQNIKRHLSVVITMYPKYEIVSYALNAVSKQSYRNFELIMVNDGMNYPKEEIEKYVLKFAPLDIPIKFVHHDKNRSSIQARFTGARCAVGEYILFLDSDDSLTEHVFRNGMARAAMYEVDIINFQFSFTSTYIPLKFLEGDDVLKTYLTRFFDGTHMICNNFFKRDMVLRAIKLSGMTKDDYMNMGEDAMLGFMFYGLAKTFLKDDSIGKYIYVRNNPNSLCYGIRHGQTFDNEEDAADYQMYLRHVQLCQDLGLRYAILQNFNPELIYDIMVALHKRKMFLWYFWNKFNPNSLQKAWNQNK